MIGAFTLIHSFLHLILSFFLRQGKSRASSVRAYASSTKDMVEKAIADNKVMIFSKSHCPFCTKAKQSVGSLLSPEKFKVLEIENMKEMNEIQDILLGITGGRSVPRVFVSGKFIGGGDDTVAKLKSGELKQLFAGAGLL